MKMDNSIRHEMWKWRAKVLRKVASENRSNLMIRKMQLKLARSIERDLQEGRL